MRQRLHSQAAGLSSTSTHDTKRGEDARARLYALSEMPKIWADAVRRWAELNTPFRQDLGGITTPEPEVEWMFYQALAGAWPPDLALSDVDTLAGLSRRMAEFMLKAVREAKVHTSWTGQDAEYEEAIEGFTRAALDPARAQAFLEDFVSTCKEVFIVGALYSLSQTAIKLMAPGVPDIYQGTELWDLSFVDPDNRRPVDFDQRRALQETIDAVAANALVAGWRSGAIKMHLIQGGLKLRAVARDAFNKGDYLTLRAEGNAAEHVVAFARTFCGDSVVVIAPRLCRTLLEGQNIPLVPQQRWDNTVVPLPGGHGRRQYYNIVTGEEITSVPIVVGEALQSFPVAVLATAALNAKLRALA